MQNDAKRSSDHPQAANQTKARTRCLAALAPVWLVETSLPANESNEARKLIQSVTAIRFDLGGIFFILFLSSLTRASYVQSSRSLHRSALFQCLPRCQVCTYNGTNGPIDQKRKSRALHPARRNHPSACSSSIRGSCHLQHYPLHYNQATDHSDCPTRSLLASSRQSTSTPLVKSSQVKSSPPQGSFPSFPPVTITSVPRYEYLCCGWTGL